MEVARVDMEELPVTEGLDMELNNEDMLLFDGASVRSVTKLPVSNLSS